MSRNTMGGGGGGGVDGVIAIYEDLSHRWAAPLFAGGKADPPGELQKAGTVHLRRPTDQLSAIAQRG